MFNQGQLVIPKLRGSETSKVLMVLPKDNQEVTQFKAVVILGYRKNGLPDRCDTPGYVSAEWYTDYFEAASWDDVRQWL